VESYCREKRAQLWPQPIGVNSHITDRCEGRTPTFMLQGNGSPYPACTHAYGDGGCEYIDSSFA
jgi:hypothetical protein